MSAVRDTLDEWRDSLLNVLPEKGPGKWILLAVLVYALIILVLAIYWSGTPDRFDPREKAAEYAATDGGEVVTGSVTTAALMGVMETLLDKPGGYIHNDRFPPGIFLDNMPNWEYGVLVQVRDMSRAMREVFSRSQSQSTEDADLAMAEPRYHFDSNSWILPSSESEYREALSYTRAYFTRLSDTDDPHAQFYARADNLRYWLSTVNTRLGSLSQRLSASVGQRRINTDLAGDTAASQSTNAPGEVVVKTPWNEIDDVFFEARGTTWALIHFLKAVEVDFADVLRKKNALVSLQQIIRELEGSQEQLWSPVILNGTGFGLFANHSLVMASYISRANAAIIDLRDLLLQG
ncbi:hypothetical protein A3709_02900 [Halioglobus sp. HI00S01]|uniref:DUF2333 family protein n=1 Tax=Halioglobus sp. HI00S01 TaxID=1822214 RepID=UPI0007C3BE02|nr:DUF2333 family protein [Halioglobus sp. HI00S01]KZX58425.1 hypothetical protein A3709_02900 [Halioglobus sp. HI00S01]